MTDESTKDDPRDRLARQRDHIRTQLRAPLWVGPIGWQELGAEYLYHCGHVLVREQYVEEVRALIARLGLALPERPGPREGIPEQRRDQVPPRPTNEDIAADRTPEHVIAGLRLLRFREDGPLDTLRVMGLIRDGGVDPRDGSLITGLGTGAASLNHVVATTGDAVFCGADEPEPTDCTIPDPFCTPFPDAGAGVKVVVVDTGLDPDAPQRFGWLAGVTGDPDPGLGSSPFGGYAGHGTFVAGLVRRVAPAAEVHVRAPFRTAGALLESDLVQALDDCVRNDHPDVISMSAGAWTYDATGLMSFEVFHETLLRHHKGVVLVAAAGNDGNRKPFWPAAAPWTVSVGALSADLSGRAHFSNHGGWVDVYAPGEGIVQAYPRGDYRYWWPPKAGQTATFTGLARWSGTSFSTPIVSGLIAARMSRTGENGTTAAAALIGSARGQALRGVGAVLLP